MPSRNSWLPPCLLLLAGALATVAACSGGDEQAGGPFGTGTASGSSSGGAAGAGGSGAGGELIIADSGVPTLSIEPAEATITITDKAAPASQAFKALYGTGGSGSEVQASWQLGSYDLGTISPQGVFQTTDIAGGKVKVVATFADLTATAELTVKVQLEEDVLSGPNDPGPSPANKAALQGPPAADPGPEASTLLYPYDGTVMPKGLLAPLVQFSGGSVKPEDAKLALASEHFLWSGYYKLANPAQPQLAIPQQIWDAALKSAAGGKLKIEVAKALGGVAYGPYAIAITVANGSLKGVVYYQTYEGSYLGIWAAHPGKQEQPKHVKTDCVVCHSVSANGKRLSAGVHPPTDPAQSGVYEIDQDGNLTQLTGAPGGLGGDSRGLSFGVFTPDGEYVMRSQSNFWGGINQLAWRIDAVGKKLDAASVVGLGPGVSALLPTFSPDGKFYAFINGPGDGFASPSRSVSVMAVTVDKNAGPAGTLTFANRKLVLDNGPGGAITKYVTFLPDPDLIVLQEATSCYAGYDYMLPTYDPGGQPGNGDGRLYLIKASTKGHLGLAQANSGLSEWDAGHNYEPFALPLPAGGYFWVVFTSVRQYGNTYVGGAVRKQLWVAAISPDVKGDKDPSHPPFYMPTQTPSRNERGFWALDPCKPQGESCEAGDECCEGFCRPSDPADPLSPKVCKPPEGGSCSQLSEKCEKDEDCCFHETGIRCLAGYCSPPVYPFTAFPREVSKDGSPSRPRSRGRGDAPEGRVGTPTPSRRDGLTSSARFLTYRSTLRAGPPGALALAVA
ncbi:MAG: hypothetical protein HY744_05320 [Deltaproteobacteria bacterium]|nr:hypothetical protein [Deltaproteobacteria bacterium]